METEDDCVGLSMVSLLVLPKVERELEIGGDLYFNDKGVITGNDEPCAVLMSLDHLPKATRQKIGKKAVRLVLNNADEDRNYFVQEVDTDNAVRFPTASFDCLARLVFALGKDYTVVGRDRERLARMLSTDALAILDFIPEHRINLTADEKRLTNTSGGAKKLKPPAPGYSRVADHWHLAATVLFYVKRSQKRYLVGVDDNQYFGVELSGRPNTIEQAFEDLTPPAARGLACSRQGEWFVVPVDESDVPSAGVCGSIMDMVLPKEDPDSNDHRLGSDDGDIRVGNGRIYARSFALSHDEHSDISKVKNDGWYEIVCNTALRSVSIAGVD